MKYYTVIIRNFIFNDALSKFAEHNLKNISRFDKCGLVRRCKHTSPMDSAKETIQAWQIHEYGDVANVKLSETTVPVLKDPEDVLIKVEAVSLNPIDKFLAGGYGKVFFGYKSNYEMKLPLTLGRDFAGTILDKGQNVGDEFKVGDSVYGALAAFKPGSLSEVILCNKSMICHRPRNLSPLEASSIAYTAMTAWSALCLQGGLTSKNAAQMKVLVLGASGGVGTVAVQILKAQGATVIGTCSADAVPTVQSLGADYVFDYRDENYILNVSRVGSFDIILDCAKFGHQNIPSSWNYKQFITLNSPLLINGDKYGFYGGLAMSAKDLFFANFPKFFQGKSVKWGFFTSSNEGLRFITKLLEEGKIIPVIHKVFKFSEVPQAYAALGEGHLRGKIVIDFK